ncbi:hypothetical protein [Rhodopila sp.]|uniref:hypothetical protein n=1 Tax=Rhodopila sp. TaxID=2480087 RepID=UPI003D14032A
MFETATGSLLMVQARHVVSIYDEHGEVKLATAAGGVHVLKEITVQRAAAMVSRADDSAPVRGGS